MLKLAKNDIIHGNMMKWLNTAPPTNPIVDNRTNGIASFFSFWYKPGAMNIQT